MNNKVTNFVLNLHKKINSFYRTNEGGRIIRKSRLKKFKKKGKRLIIAAQIVAIWYLLILTGSYLTKDTGAYFNDVEKISGTVSVSEDWCKDAKNGSDFWHKYCKDNAGKGNGPDTPDEDTGEHTDPDNPGDNKGGCDDHTNAPCIEDGKEIKSTDAGSTNTESDKELPENVSDLTGNRNGDSQNINLFWKNPSNISFVRIYKDGEPTPIEDNVKGENINLISKEEVSYRVTTVDSAGNESLGETVTVK